MQAQGPLGMKKYLKKPPKGSPRGRNNHIEHGNRGHPLSMSEPPLSVPLPASPGWEEGLSGKPEPRALCGAHFSREGGSRAARQAPCPKAFPKAILSGCSSFHPAQRTL